MMNKKGMKSILFTMKATAVVLALFAMVLLSSCSPSTVPLCRVGINRGDSSRTITAAVDPLGRNIYYRTKYKGSDKSYSYSSNPTDNYIKLSSEGILVSQGLWEVQVVFSNEDNRTHYTEDEAKSLVHATSGDIFINLNTTSITVELKSGDGSVQINSYNLTGSIPSPSIDVSLMYYDGSSFVSFSDPNYDIKDFTTLTADSNNAFKNTITTLPSGVYCLVLNVQSSSSVILPMYWVL